MGTLRFNGGGGLDCRAIEGINTVFFSGSNIEVSNDQYEKCKTHPYLKQLFDQRVLEYKKANDKIETVDLGIPIKEDKETGEKIPVVNSELRSSLGTELPLVINANGETQSKNITKKKGNTISIPVEEIEKAKKVSANPYE